MKVAILGGGLSAAYAWRSCLDAGITPKVYTDRIFSPLGGFIFAHWLPPSVDAPHLWKEIGVGKIGTAEIYARKMWDRPDIKTSFPEEIYTVKGVNPVAAAKALWGPRDSLREHLVLTRLTPASIQEITDANDLVIQTFLIHNPFTSFKTPIWLRPYSPGANLVVYNGVPETPYVRHATLFGMQSFEFPPLPRGWKSLLAETFGTSRGFDNDPRATLWYAPEIPPPEIRSGVQNVERVPPDEKILQCGRWTEGTRKSLSHEAYLRVQKKLEVLLGKDLGDVHAHLDGTASVQREASGATS